jgi:hypothetical protein
MYINRLLLAVFGVFLVLQPSVHAWLFSADAPWYRPHLVWLALVFATYWNQRSRYRDEL